MIRRGICGGTGRMRCRWSTVRGVVRRGISLYLFEAEAHEIIPSWVIARQMSRSVVP